MKNKKNRGIKPLLITTLVIILLSNTPPAQYFLLENYHYRNKDSSFSFSEEPAQAIDFKVAEKRWQRFKDSNPNKDQILYRTFRIKPWQFWEWWQYIAHTERFTLPYLEDEKK